MFGLGSPPEMHDVPIAIGANGTRQDLDRVRAVEVPADKHWCAQTRRPPMHFSIGTDRMPKTVHRKAGDI